MGLLAHVRFVFSFTDVFVNIYVLFILRPLILLPLVLQDLEDGLDLIHDFLVVHAQLE